MIQSTFQAHRCSQLIQQLAHKTSLTIYLFTTFLVCLGSQATSQFAVIEPPKPPDFPEALHHVHQSTLYTAGSGDQGWRISVTCSSMSSSPDIELTPAAYAFIRYIIEQRKAELRSQGWAEVWFLMAHLAHHAYGPVAAIKQSATQLISSRTARYILHHARRVKSGCHKATERCRTIRDRYFPKRQTKLLLQTEQGAAPASGFNTRGPSAPPQVSRNLIHATEGAQNPINTRVKKIKPNKDHNVRKAAEELAARNGAPVGRLGKLSESDFEKTVSFATAERDLRHFFDPKHNFDRLIRSLGSQKEVVRTVLKKADGLFPAFGVFEDVFVEINGYFICLHGRVIEGIPRISTMFPTMIDGILTYNKKLLKKG